MELVTVRVTVTGDGGTEKVSVINLSGPEVTHIISNGLSTKVSHMVLTSPQERIGNAGKHIGLVSAISATVLSMCALLFDIFTK